MVRGSFRASFKTLLLPDSRPHAHGGPLERVTTVRPGGDGCEGFSEVKGLGWCGIILTLLRENC